MRPNESYSSISDYAACPARYHAKYILRLRRAVEHDFLWRGTQWHRLLELFHSGLTGSMGLGELEKIMRHKSGPKLFQLISEYWARWGELRGLVEQPFTLSLGSFGYRGVIDLITHDCNTDTITVWDHKLLGSEWGARRFLRPLESLQLVGYGVYLRSLGYRKIDLAYNLAFWSAKKPANKFRRICEPLTDRAVSDWHRTVSGYVRLIRRDDTWPQNRESCRNPYRCDFLDACESGFSGLRSLGYYREEKRDEVTDREKKAEPRSPELYRAPLRPNEDR